MWKSRTTRSNYFYSSYNANLFNNLSALKFGWPNVCWRRDLTKTTIFLLNFFDDYCTARSSQIIQILAKMTQANIRPKI